MCFISRSGTVSGSRCRALMYGSSLSLASFLPWELNHAAIRLTAARHDRSRTEHLPEKRPCRQQGSVDDSLPCGPFLREDQCEVFGGENLAQTEIEIGLPLLVQAKDLVPQSGRGRVCHERPPCRLNVSWIDIESSIRGLLSIPIPDSRHRVETYS